MQIYFKLQGVNKFNVSSWKQVGIMPKFEHLLFYIKENETIEELGPFKNLNTNPSSIVLEMANPVY
jgi:hypothetical protein